MHARFYFGVIFLVCLLACLGCDDSSSSPSGPDEQGTNSGNTLSGTWQGMWYSEWGPWQGSLRAELLQDGNRFQGTLYIGNSECMPFGTMTGELNGNQVVMGVVSGEDEAYYAAVLLGNRMEGDWVVLGGACEGDSGTFYLQK